MGWYDNSKIGMLDRLRMSQPKSAVPPSPAQPAYDGKGNISTDGGQTWSQPAYDGRNGYSVDGGQNWQQFANDGKGRVSIDGGESWQRSPASIPVTNSKPSTPASRPRNFGSGSALIDQINSQKFTQYQNDNRPVFNDLNQYEQAMLRDRLQGVIR